MRILELPAVNAEIAHALDFISNSLGEFDVADKKTVQNAMLSTEESLVKLLEHTSNDAIMEISVKKTLMGAILINLAVPGKGFGFYRDMGWHDTVEIEETEMEDMEDEIRGVVMTNIDGVLRYEHKKDTNIVSISLKK